ADPHSRRLRIRARLTGAALLGSQVREDDANRLVGHLLTQGNEDGLEAVNADLARCRRDALIDLLGYPGREGLGPLSADEFAEVVPERVARAIALSRYLVQRLALA